MGYKRLLQKNAVLFTPQKNNQKMCVRSYRCECAMLASRELSESTSSFYIELSFIKKKNILFPLVLSKLLKNV